MTVRATITQILETTDEVDPEIIKHLVIAGLRDDELREALTESLKPYIRYVMAQHRSASTTSAPLPSAPAGGNTGVSVKGVRLRTWADKIRDGVYTSSGWKPLGTCTVDDFVFLVNHHERVAEQNIDKADFYRLCAKELQNENVSTLADLRDATKKHLLDD